MTGVLLSGAVVTTASAEEHEVQKGESLWDIANEYETTVDELVEINDLNTTVIQPKQNIYINSTYVVQQGDSLSSISGEHGVSVDDLKKWNDLHTSLIVIGQELEIKGINVDKEDSKQVETQVEPVEETEAKETTEATETTESETVQAETEATNEPTQEAQGETFSVTATAYTAGCEGCSGITSTGVDLNANPNAKVIAVDPNVIPLGSEVYVEGYGYAIAADVGGAIKGDRIDIHVPSKGEANNWGVRNVNVTVVE